MVGAEGRPPADEQLFADELSVDLAVFPFVRDWSVDDRRMLASLIAETMIHMTAELLDAFGFSERGRAMLFEVFAHSFFNTEQRYSAAEFLAMCHFYFTGNPEGLGMDAPRDQYATTLWEPFTRLLEKHGGVSGDVINWNMDP